MTDSWREMLYPLGFLASLAFSGRLFSQWVQSEVQKKSVVPRSFWSLSLIGNVLLTLHAFIQGQFHVFLIQSCNGCISWRNLNLMQQERSQYRFRTVCAIFVATVATFSAAYMAFNGTGGWFRIPINPWFAPVTSVDPIWHGLGCTGLGLFASRFWFQWVCAERNANSYLGPSFWWLSLAGASMMFIYFARILDIVNALGAAFGMIPALRNLILIRNSAQLSTQEGV